jgi:hypothetical protein
MPRCQFQAAKRESSTKSRCDQTQEIKTEPTKSLLSSPVGGLIIQFIEVKRASPLGAQVVKINADLLHFQGAPPASESSIGVVDLTGVKGAAHASVRNANMSRFIAVLPFPVIGDDFLSGPVL